MSHLSHLSGRLVPSHKAILLAELLHLYSVISQYVPTLVTFISQKHSSHMFAIGKCQFGIQVLLPFGDGLKGGGPCDVKHDEGAHGLTVVDTSHVAKPLLTWKTHITTHNVIIANDVITIDTHKQRYRCTQNYIKTVLN